MVNWFSLVNHLASNSMQIMQCFFPCIKPPPKWPRTVSALLGVQVYLKPFIKCHICRPFERSRESTGLGSWHVQWVEWFATPPLTMNLMGTQHLGLGREKVAICHCLDWECTSILLPIKKKKKRHPFGDSSRMVSQYTSAPVASRWITFWAKFIFFYRPMEAKEYLQ